MKPVLARHSEKASKTDPDSSAAVVAVVAVGNVQLVGNLCTLFLNFFGYIQNHPLNFSKFKIGAILPCAIGGASS